jgi:hypothetical protein
MYRNVTLVWCGSVALPQQHRHASRKTESCIVGSWGTLAPGEAPQAIAQVQLAVPGAAGHAPEVAARRVDGLAFGSDHCDGRRRLVASHRLAGIDPRRSADAEPLTKTVRSFDNIGPARRNGEDVGLQLGGDAEDELWRHGRKRLL